MKTPSKIVLPIIVFAQFCCTSLWFAGNGVLHDLMHTFKLSSTALGNLTSSVQFGFIIGTLTFAILTISDRYSATKVFFGCAILGAISNLGLLFNGNTLVTILGFRFLTGFFLAGIYPVGMKIAADYFENGLGKALGFLVGALVLGSALPHLLSDISANFQWQNVILSISSIAALGGILLLVFVKDGPYRKSSQQLELDAFLMVFKNNNFKAAAFGYFGHMWELYAFWTFVPVIIESYKLSNTFSELNTSLTSFFVIGIGSIACIGSGFLSLKFETQKIAFYTLLLSGVCCLVSPFFFSVENEWIFVSFLLFWGMVVIADSPLFSTLVALHAIPKVKGTALTIVNCIGFSITILSIQLLNYLIQLNSIPNLFMILAIGPILGLTALFRYKKQSIKVT